MRDIGSPIARISFGSLRIEGSVKCEVIFVCVGTLKILKDLWFIQKKPIERIFVGIFDNRVKIGWLELNDGSGLN